MVTGNTVAGCSFPVSRGNEATGQYPDNG